MAAGPPPSPWDKGLALLARRPHLRRELQTKLLARGYEASEVETTLDRLEERHFLDDEAAARGFVSARLRRGPEGAARLRAELERRGADGDLARRVVEALVPQDDAEPAREAARRFSAARRMPTRPDRRWLARLAGHLQRKGFSHRAISQVLGELRG